MNEPALVARPRLGQITAVVAGVTQIWALGRARRFERTCKLCPRRVRIGEMSWRPASNIAPNRADRVCLACWHP